MGDSHDSFFRATAKLIGQIEELESLESDCGGVVRIVKALPTELVQAIQLHTHLTHLEFRNQLMIA